ncbi:MAG: hypothetical protein LBT62_04120, partial [Deltaproteobacteria bacterium]|nr:hypothetical protein [Deltaproteobacteria bacterium]
MTFLIICSILEVAYGTGLENSKTQASDLDKNPLGATPMNSAYNYYTENILTKCGVAKLTES